MRPLQIAARGSSRGTDIRYRSALLIVLQMSGYISVTIACRGALRSRCWRTGWTRTMLQLRGRSVTTWWMTMNLQRCGNAPA